MSDRLERWKTREKLRSDIGWAAVFVGLWGLLAVAVGLAELAGSESIRVEGPLAPLVLPVGFALAFCAVGLWNARSWARWTAAALFAGLLVNDVLRIVSEQTLSLGLPFVLFAVVYLLLPSTGKRFAKVARLD